MKPVLVWVGSLLALPFAVTVYALHWVQIAIIGMAAGIECVSDLFRYAVVIVYRIALCRVTWTTALENPLFRFCSYLCKPQIKL